MSNIETPIFSGSKFHCLIPCCRPVIISSLMWRNVAKRAISISSSLKFSKTYSRAYGLRSLPENSNFPENFKFRSVEPFSSASHDLYSRRTGEVLNNGNWCNGLCPRGYAIVAEAVSSTDVEEEVSVVDEIQEILQEMKREEQKEVLNGENRRERVARGKGSGKYSMLRRRQVKMETEAWEQAAEEYKELLMDMCAQKLAPNLPYMKSLFLGWFEPIRDAIIKEQELCRTGKIKSAYAPYFDQLPADKMTLITMHKLMGLLMTGGDHGIARVVQAACTIGDAIEQEAIIHKFLEKTKKKKGKKKKEDEGGESETVNGEQEKLRKKVNDLIKKQKLPAVRQIVKGHDDSKPWGQDARAKVGSRLIELLIQTAYIQSPASQLADTPPDVRPAFVHTFRTVAKENKKFSRKYGVIECDPLVIKGLEKTARHVVIPYMPMLVPPVKWTGPLHEE